MQTINVDQATGEDKAIAADAKLAEDAEAHRKFLRDEFISALRIDPEWLVSTPGYGTRQPETEAWAVLQDMFASEQGDDILRDLTRLLGSMLIASDPLALRIANKVAAAHANYHAGDKV